MSLANYAVARCIKEAAAFFEVAGEAREKGEVKNYYAKDSYIASLSEDFEPSEQWKDALWKLYAVLSQEIRDAILYPDHDGFDSREVRVWLEAYRDDKFASGGWVHRIILIINYARRANEAAVDLGDSEFDLMKRVIETKTNEISDKILKKAERESRNN